MTNNTATDGQLRVIEPDELALLVTMHRRALGWTQETLAEITGLTVRTVQRVEKGETSSIDTRRALARGFKIEDIDAFNKPHTFRSTEQIKEEAEEFKRKHLTLAVTVATAGKQLADFVEQSTMRCFQQPDNVCSDVAERIAEIFDFLGDYREIADQYSFTQKLQVHATLDGHIGRLRDAGFSICYALRKTSIMGKDWVDKTPMPVGVAYAFAVKRGDEPKLVAVPKALDLAF